MAAILGEAARLQTMRPLLPGEQVGRKWSVVGAAAHKRVRREEEEERGIVQKTLERGLVPSRKKQLVGLTAAPGSKVSGGAG